MAQKPARYDDWEEVAIVRQVYEAELEVMRLQEAGIESQVLDQSFELIPLPDVGSFELVRVVVPIARAEEARRILASPASVPDDADVGSVPEVPIPGDEPVKE